MKWKKKTFCQSLKYFRVNVPGSQLHHIINQMATNEVECQSILVKGCNIIQSKIIKPNTFAGFFI